MTCHLPEWITYPERQIISRILDEALARNCMVSVNDGEEWAVVRSTHRPTIENAIGQTDCTTLRFTSTTQSSPETGRPVTIGQVFLVHGNGSDVIADHTDTEAITALLKSACDLAEVYNAAGV